jgi:arylsulfatase A-like enzyme
MRYTGEISAGLDITMPVQSMDLMPTILDYAGIEIPENIQAVSLRPYIEGTIPLSANRSIFSEVDKIDDPANVLAWASPPDDLRSINEDDWKYIHHLNQPDSSELYLLQSTSIYETQNIINQEPEKQQELKVKLFDWFYPFRIFLPLNFK